MRAERAAKRGASKKMEENLLMKQGRDVVFQSGKRDAKSTGLYERAMRI